MSIEYRIERLENIVSKVCAKTELSKISYPDFGHEYTVADQTTVVLLTLFIYSEAGDEPSEGKYAIGNVIKNRGTLSPKYGESVREIILSPDQSLNLSSIDPTSIEGLNELYNECFEIADSILAGDTIDNTDGATHYWNPDGTEPVWVQEMVPTVKIGNYQFGKYQEE